MQSGIQLDEASKTIYKHLYKDQKGFEAEVILNARDAMVFAHIKKLPESQQDAITSTKEFLAIFANNYGAKSTLHIAPELLKQLPEGTLKSTKGVGRYISIADAQEAIAEVRIKPHVADQLTKFTNDEFKFLTKNDLLTRTAELSEFKIKYSSFASKAKIEFGQYSEKAEEEKLKNPFVEHYAIEHDGKIIACVMHVTHGDKTYDADFVIHPDYRSRGLAQALCVMVHDHTLEIQKHFTGLWFIAGGYGAKDVGGHLYDEVFPTKALQNDAELQNSVGIFLMFDDPRYELLLAGNRNPQSKLVNDDETKYVDEALSILAQSTEQDLAATQPAAVVTKDGAKKEEVVPISIFTNQDKSSTVLPKKNPQQKVQAGFLLLALSAQCNRVLNTGNNIQTNIKQTSEDEIQNIDDHSKKSGIGFGPK